MPLKVIQHSKVTNTIYPLSLPTNISFTLAEDWISDNISILFDGVAEENDIITNGDFFLKPKIVKKFLPPKDF